MNLVFQSCLPAIVALVAVVLATELPVCGQDSNPNLPIDFDRQIKPILSDRCFVCHGPDAEAREADLRLDAESGVVSMVVAKEPENSDLYLRIAMDDDDRMPPPDSNLSLTDDEKELIKRWIEEGAHWNQHWAFVAPERLDPPTCKDIEWSHDPIDAFILDRLTREGLSPTKPATKEKLIRRVTFDLTGLPPTLAEIDTFVADQSPRAYETLVDRLLTSDRYGERMASDWLDIARYSDTYGYQVDRDRFVWPWRDWVIRTFNKNMPYDQFITEQIAGDLIENATDDQILATTFNRLHPQKVEGGSVEEEFRVEYVADRSQTIGMAFMGLTIECARCHDHKYDPITQKEYYQLFAFFNNIDESGLYSYFDPAAVPTPSLLLSDTATKKLLNQRRTTIAELEESIHQYRSDSLQENQELADWMNQLVRRAVETKSNVGGQIHVVDFESTSLGNNALVEGPFGGKAIMMTGDDELKIETGGFRRHQPFTVATRIKIPANEDLLKRAVIFHRTRAWTDSASRGYQLLLDEGRLNASLIHFWPGNAISVRTRDLVETNQWIHVAMVYDGSSRAEGIQIFIDGVPVPVEIVRDNLQKTIIGSGTDRLVIGARFRDIGFKNGRLADFRVFDRELTAIEVSRLNDEGVFS